MVKYRGGKWVIQVEYGLGHIRVNFVFGLRCVGSGSIELRFISGPLDFVSYRVGLDRVGLNRISISQINKTHIRLMRVVGIINGHWLNRK